MNVGIVGLGKMGSAIAQRLVDAGYNVIGFDTDRQACQQAKENGVEIVDKLADVAQKARVIWLSLPAGLVVDEVIEQLMIAMKEGDIIIDAGNNHYIDSQRRASLLALRKIFFLDCGLSGGLQARGKGFCLMIGGDAASYTKVEAIFAAVAAPGGVAHVGSSGAGHYVKMVHNAIEYGLLEAYAEGLHLLHAGSFAKELDLANIADLWNHGSLIRSWLLEIAHTVLEQDEELKKISGEVAQGGTAQWASEDAKKRGIALPVIDEAIKARKESQKSGGNYATKLIAMMRHIFGGHAITVVKK